MKYIATHPVNGVFMTSSIQLLASFLKVEVKDLGDTHGRWVIEVDDFERELTQDDEFSMDILREEQ